MMDEKEKKELEQLRETVKQQEKVLIQISMLQQLLKVKLEFSMV